MNFPSLLKSAVFFLCFFFGGGGEYTDLLPSFAKGTSHSYSSTSQSDTPGILPHQCTTPILQD